MSYVQHMLGQHEKLVFVTHQHWMTLAWSALANFGIALLIAVLVGALRFAVDRFGVLGSSGAANLIYLGLLLWVIPVARFVYHYFIWENREYIITNRRVIQIAGIFNKNVVDSSLEKVNDVKMSQSILGRTFDYGDVEILTASELAPNLFHHILSPVRFKTEMLNQKEAMSIMETAAPGSATPVPAIPVIPDVPTLIGQLDQLRKQGIISEEEFQRKKQELLSRI
ncbi:MAG: PH domain-containing protein [Anaerolineae bacterium]